MILKQFNLNVRLNFIRMSQAYGLKMKRDLVFFVRDDERVSKPFVVF